METIKCKICNVEKQLDQYEIYKMKGNGPYRRKQCRKCRSIKSAAHRYKLTFDEVKKIKEQDHCEICKINLEWSDRYIDHNHDTSAVRGILCPRCNSVLELFEQSKELIDPIKKYLKKYD